ncbi:hypothetical protein [Vibrio sinaloensis]|uniref:hypothetical protein n=1 Tax=Photobacterium sp. (strain ATCC 43367) TaxID=379097 RepID=UPI002F3F0694
MFYIAIFTGLMSLRHKWCCINDNKALVGDLGFLSTFGEKKTTNRVKTACYIDRSSGDVKMTTRTAIAPQSNKMSGALCIYVWLCCGLMNACF